ncbi:MAG: PASTA domain-containing protein [Acidobacteria bacterium]|nr:PASTA domain-containing protein [Acidobacteriota bacterium]
MVWRPASGSLPGILRTSALAFALLVGLGAAFLVSAYYTMRITVSGHQVPVPDLVELTEEEAGRRAEADHLRVEVAGERYDPRAARGLVLEQDPPPGSQIKEGRKIRVILSLGVRTMLVPDLRGSSARKAQITLQQEGLRVGDIAFLHSPGLEENQVIAQDPASDTPRQRDGRVNLLVSRGRREPRYVMPDLVGRRLAEVKAFLGLTGMPIGQIREEDPGTAPPGSVLRQFPPAGYPVGPRQPVTLVVGSVRGGPEPASGEEPPAGRSGFPPVPPRNHGSAASGGRGTSAAAGPFPGMIPR